MQKSHLSNRHYTRDYDRKNRDRPGGHCPTQVLREGWKECLSSHGRKYAKHVRAKAIRRANKLLIAEELLMFWEQITEKQIMYEIAREPREFKPRSKGSPKGRTIGERHYQEVPENQSQEEEQTVISLSDRLFMLAAEAAELEKKSLKDYSTDELIAELKTRMK